MKLLKALQSPLAVFIAALAVRLIFAAHLPAFLSVGGNPFRGNEPSHIAAHLALGEGFSSPYHGIPVMPTAQQPPLYALLLAMIFKIFGVYSRASLLAILIVNAVAGAAAAWLTLAVGQHYFAETPALIAAWIWALLPSIAATDLFLAHYTLSTCLLLLWLLVLPRMPDSRRNWIVLGIACGLAALLNPMLLLVLPASWAWLVQKKKFALLMALATIATAMPWMLRNYLVLGHAYPLLRDNFGLELFIGNHPGMNQHSTRACAWHLCDGTYDYTTGDLPAGSSRFAALGEAAYMQEKQREAISYIRAEPDKFFLRTARRAASFWLLPYPWFYIAVIVLALIGTLKAPRSLRLFIATMAFLYPLAFYVTQITWAPSYRHPIEPLILLAAAYALELGVLHPRRQSSAPQDPIGTFVQKSTG